MASTVTSLAVVYECLAEPLVIAAKVRRVPATFQLPLPAWQSEDAGGYPFVQRR